MHTSFSALETYESCPLKYKYQVIDKLKSPKRIEAVFGTLVHSALRFMFTRGPLYPTETEVINFFTEKWNEKSNAIVWTQEEDKEKGEKAYYQEGVKIIKNFYTKNKPWDFNPIELESRFMLKIKDDKTGDEHTIAGIIDRIDKNPESDVYEIIDYKTGKKMPSQEKLDENLQLGLYQMSLLDRWPNLKPSQVITSLYFLKHNEKITSTPSDERKKAVKEKILSAIREIEKNKKSGNFPPTPSALCDWCGFRKICPMWSHEYKKDVIETPDDETASKAIKEFFELKTRGEAEDKRLKELREIIIAYMDSKKIERVFGGEGFITRSIVERVSFDLDKIEELLKKEGIWNKILEPDTKLLQKLLPTLKEDLQEKIKGAEKRSKTLMLKQSKK